jgi:hypothetical protein
MSYGGGHLGFPIGIKNRKLVKDIPMIIHLQFGFSQLSKVHVNYCHHLASVVCKLHISSFFSETTGPIGTKLRRHVPWMVLYKVSVFRSSRRWPPSWISDRHKKQKVGKGYSNDHSFTVWVQSVH